MAMATKKSPKYTAFIAASIDGRISKNSHAKIDWTSKEDWSFLQKSLKSFDAVVVGRNTYELAKKNLEKRNTFIFTNKNLKSYGSVHFLQPKNSNLSKIFASYSKVAILGGTQVYNYFLEKAMLDELYLTIEPIVVLDGVPMFSGKKWQQYNFKLSQIKKINNKGTILLKYIYAN